MSELNDDLLSYELGDDIDDQALYGADEDELLLSDDELEKDVTKEEKQQIKAEAEQWVKSQIKDKEQKNGLQHATTSKEASSAGIIPISESTTAATTVAIETIEVTSTAATMLIVSATAQGAYSADDVTTSEVPPVKPQTEFKQPTQQQQQQQQQQEIQQHQPQLSMSQTQSSTTSSADEVTSSSSKEIELDHSSVISCSTSNFTDTSSIIQSSQESTCMGVGGLGSGDFSDPREDFDDEREVRTNIKTTNEREIESAGSDQSPDKHHNRFMHGKRGGNPLLRPYSLRGSPYHQRPLLRYPPHGQFPPQQSQNPFTPHASLTGGGQQQTQNPISQIPLHQHDPMNPNHPQRMRLPYPGFRPGGNMGFRHPNPAGMYSQVPHEYGSGGGPLSYNQNYGHMPHPSRPMFRTELPGGPMSGLAGMPLVMRPGMRMQRPPLQALPPHGMPPNYVNGPPMRLQPPLQQQQQQQHQAAMPLVPGVAPPVGGAGVSTTSSVAVSGQQPSQLQIGGATATALPTASAMRPNKVLINPNFKGGVEAATNKFIKETQFMSTISSHVSHLQSDEELLRQQEEFINKNRQHIEKRRHERSPPSTSLRRSRSRSPRSHSRERSYTPPNKRGGGSGGGGGGANEHSRHFERERGDRGVDRDRSAIGGYSGGGGGGGGGGINRGNRFRRGNSRDRDYEKRNAVGNYGKRRRSLSPVPNRSGPSGRRAGSDRERNDVEEDEETRAYRLEIEKQKALREKIMRDKEMKRRRAAEEKLHEEKRTTLSQSNTSGSGGGGSGGGGSGNNNANNSNDDSQPQKLKPIIVTERKIISLKKRQQQRESDDNNDHSQQQQQQYRHHHHQQQQQQRKQIPTAKILPEAKRTLTDHLLYNASSVSGGGGGSNTAIIKPVQKKETNTLTPPPPIATTSSTMKHMRRLSTPSDDEVELDYDEDELMLEEEDRLLATPTPSPQRLPQSRTPTPEPPPSAKTLTTKSNAGRNRLTSAAQHQQPFANRRVVIKSSTSSSSSSAQATASGSSNRNRDRDLDLIETSKNRRGSSNRSGNGTGGSSNNNNSSSSSTRKGIFNRLDARKQQQLQSSGSSNSNDGKRKGQQQRIVLK